jgi:hypothetical protein
MPGGFVATGDTCGDLEFDSQYPMNAEDLELNRIFESYRLDPSYVPVFNDLRSYAQILYKR